jgi:streptogramin lyase
VTVSVATVRGLARRLVALLAIVLASTAVAVLPASAAAAPAVTGTFSVPGVETNNKIVAGPEGDIWVTLGGATDNVARVTPAGEVKEFELGLEATSGITVGPEGKIWVTANEAVADFTPADPEGTVVKTPVPEVKGFHSIVTGPDGKMWVATEEEVIRFAPGTPALRETKAIPGLTPHDIDVAAGSVVIADGGAPRIVTLDTSLQEKDYSYGAAGGSQGLAASPSGQIAFSDPGATPEQIGLITPPSPATTVEQLGDPFGVAYGVDQAFWFAQFNNGELVRLTSTGQRSFLGGLPKESPRQITAGPGNTLWVTLVKAGEEGVARISGLEPPSVVSPPVVSPPPTAPPTTASPARPQTKLLKGPKPKLEATGKRTRVSFRFASSTAGATFQCMLTKTVKGKKPATRFAACRSPRSYSLAPGRYRFSVRATAAGVADPSPAVRSFRVLSSRSRRPGAKVAG